MDLCGNRFLQNDSIKTFFEIQSELVSTPVEFRVLHIYLTHYIYQLALEGQLPHKTVNMMFWFSMANNKLTILWGI